MGNLGQQHHRQTFLLPGTEYLALYDAELRHDNRKNADIFREPIRGR
jgi:hypothetical protein